MKSWLCVAICLLISPWCCAQDRAMFGKLSEHRLKELFFIALDNKSVTSEDIEDLTALIGEFKSIASYITQKYNQVIETQQVSGKPTWDDKIALQPSNFKQHKYYRALFGYYLAYYSAGALDLQSSWAQVDSDNRLGHAMYDFLECRKVLQEISVDEASRGQSVLEVVTYFSYVSGQNILDSKLKTVWENGLRQNHLTGENSQVAQFLYNNEFNRLWAYLYKNFQKNPNNRFDLFWDETFWLKKTKKDFDDHRFYRSILCSYIRDIAQKKGFQDGSEGITFAIGFSEFIGCEALNIQNYYEFPWYKDLVDRKQSHPEKYN